MSDTIDESDEHVEELKSKLRKLIHIFKGQLKDSNMMRREFEYLERHPEEVLHTLVHDLFKIEIEYPIPSTIIQNSTSKAWIAGFLVTYKITNTSNVHLYWRKLWNAFPDHIMIGKAETVTVRRFFPIYESQDKTMCMLVGNEKLKDWDKPNNTKMRFKFHVWLKLGDPKYSGELREAIVPD
jgi:hypothetical protein